MFRYLLITGFAAAGFYPLDAGRGSVDTGRHIRSLTPAVHYGRNVEVFHCQSCHQYQTEYGPYAHYFHGAMFASLINPFETRAGDFTGVPETPLGDDTASPLKFSSNLSPSIVSIFDSGEDSDISMDCHIFNACHEDPPGQWGLCGQNHTACGGGGSEVLAAVLDAQKMNSLTAMNRVAAKYPLFVRIVADRGVVLLISCNGELVRQEKFSDLYRGE